MTVEFSLEADGLPLSAEEVFRAWHCPPDGGNAFVEAVVERTLEAARPRMAVRAGYRRLDAREIDLETGPVIGSQLEGASSLVVFLVTLGPGYDEWVRSSFRRDPLVGCAADTIGSLAVEEAAEILEGRVDAELLGEGLGATRRLSPGYCGWDVAGQAALFAALPEGFLGVRLSPSFMMVPLKSVSGVIGAGRRVAKRPYPCATCGIESCSRRRRGA